MPKLAVILSHKLTESQKTEALKELGCGEIIYPPEELGSSWGSIPADEEDITALASGFINWIAGVTVKGDYILVSGDYGMTFMVTHWAIDNDRIPVYSAGERDYRFLDEGENGVVNIHRFNHVKFRRFRYYTQ